jgi:hypothetical protein
MPLPYPSFNDDPMYGSRTRQSRGYPTVDPPAAPVYAPPPPKYTDNQWAQHQNAISDVDRLLAAEKDPAIRQRLVAQKNEMQAAYRAHRPYPNFADRALDQQAMQTGVSVANSQIAGQTATNTIKAQAPVAAASVNAQGRVAAAQVQGETRRDVAATNAKARERAAQILAAPKVGGAMPSQEQMQWAQDVVAGKNVGPEPGAAQTTPTAPAPKAPTTQPSAPRATAESTATASFPAQGTEEAPSVPAPSLPPPTIPEAKAAQYENPYQTTPPERPVVGSVTSSAPGSTAPGSVIAPDGKTYTAADGRRYVVESRGTGSSGGITVKTGDYGNTPQESASAKQAQAEPEFSDTDRAAYQAYRQSSGDRSISMRAFLSGPYKQYQQANKADAARYDAERAPSLAQVTNTARRDSAENLAGINKAMSSPEWGQQWRQDRANALAAGGPTIAPTATRTAQYAAAHPSLTPPTPAPAAQTQPTPQRPYSIPEPLPPTLISDDEFERRYGAMRSQTILPSPAPVATTQPAAPTLNPPQAATRPAATTQPVRTVNIKGVPFTDNGDGTVTHPDGRVYSLLNGRIAARIK